jgi:hypothetical protein
VKSKFFNLVLLILNYHISQSEMLPMEDRVKSKSRQVLLRVRALLISSRSPASLPINQTLSDGFGQANIRALAVCHFPAVVAMVKFRKIKRQMLCADMMLARQSWFCRCTGNAGRQCRLSTAQIQDVCAPFRRCQSAGLFESALGL